MSCRATAVLIAAMIYISPASARAQELGTGAGPGLSLAGAAQGLWQQVQADPGRGVDGVEQFRARRVHLYFYGQPSDQVNFSFTLAYNDGREMTIGVYEAWIRVRLTDWWAVKAGSFLPPWTIEMPKPVHELDFIRYPLIVDSGLPVMTPWRQTGLLADFQIGGNLAVAAGLFAGLDREGEYQDNNNMKDTMIAVSFQAYPGLILHFGHWGGKSVQEIPVPGLGSSSLEYLNTLVGFEAEHKQWRLSGEALWNQVDSRGGTLRKTFGYHLSTVYTRDKIQGLLRYEFLDPETSDRRNGVDDEMEWTTIGINYLPLPAVKLMGAYIFKSERGDNQAANEELLLQISLSF